jgi:hypothetical protein
MLLPQTLIRTLIAAIRYIDWENKSLPLQGYEIRNQARTEGWDKPKDEV